MNLLQIMCDFASFKRHRTKSTIDLLFDAQEMQPELLAKMVEHCGKTGWLSFLPGEEMIKPEDVVDLPEIKTLKDEKSPSKGLKDTMFVYYKLANKTHKGFNSWYADSCEHWRQQYLERIREYD